MEDNNIKIAQFMGYKYQEKLLIGKSDWRDEDFNYYRNWNALMDVVEYIENYIILSDDNWVNITIGSGIYCVIQDANSELFEFSCSMETKIKSVYNAILEFINWYNEQEIKSN